MSAESTTPRVLDGKFQIISELGRGRLGRLFKARLLTSEKLVAIRVFDTAHLAGPTGFLKLMSEIVAARSLHHRDICTISGFRMAGELPYLVMEHVHGRTLEEELATRPAGRFNLDEFPPLAASLLRALQYAHAKGVAHGNLHPGNLMLRPEGSLSLLDCGLGCPGAARYPETVAPELPAGGCSAEGDLFAAGAIFYRMLTGVWPQSGGESKPGPIVGAEPPLNQAILACLEGDPAARPTPAQLLRTLEVNLSAPQAHPPAAEPGPVAPSPAEDSEEQAAEPARQLNTAYSLPFSAAATLLVVFSLAVVAQRSGGAVTETPLSAAPRVKAAARTPDLAPATTLEAAPPRHRAGDVWTSSRLSSEFVHVPAGTAILGSPADEPGRDGDEDRHTVQISKGFWIGRHLVTQREWESVMGTRPWQGKMESRPDLPATWVSWEQVNEFIHRLNRSTDREIYRLPSEAEWEFAARGGSGPDWPAEPAKLPRSAWHRDNANGAIQPVGRREASPLGLMEIRGCAWEWVHDWYSEYPKDLQIDPQGPTSGDQRVVRGCSFFNPASICRIADRHKVNPRSGEGHVGFRLVRESH